MSNHHISRRQLLKVASALSLFALSNPGRVYPQQTPGSESRAILDEGLNWVTAASAENLCQRIKRAGFNVFIPCIWHGRGTTWPSVLAPWDSNNKRVLQFDPLENLLQTARRYEIEVHPWFTVGLRQRDFFPEFASEQSRESFDFHRPAFRDFIVTLILEVVEKYPINGVNLDFVRFGFARQGHEAEQEAVVADVVRRVSLQSKRIKPGIVVSVCAAPWSPTIKQYGQDAPKWADEGIVDVIYSMQYQYDPDFEITKQIQGRMTRPQAMVVMVGNFDRAVLGNTVKPRDAKRVCDLIEQARKLSMKNGVAVYLYSMLSDEQIDLLQKTVFSIPAKPRWKISLQPPSSLNIQ